MRDCGRKSLLLASGVIHTGHWDMAFDGCYLGLLPGGRESWPGGKREDLGFVRVC
jgi:hypothetical protein